MTNSTIFLILIFSVSRPKVLRASFLPDLFLSHTRLRVRIAFMRFVTILVSRRLNILLALTPAQILIRRGLTVKNTRRRLKLTSHIITGILTAPFLTIGEISLPISFLLLGLALSVRRTRGTDRHRGCGHSFTLPAVRTAGLVRLTSVLDPEKGVKPRTLVPLRLDLCALTRVLLRTNFLTHRNAVLRLELVVVAKLLKIALRRP